MKYQHTVGKSTVEYDSETGAFIWLVCYRKPWMVGKSATRPLAHGYLYIKMGGRCISASRLAWTLVKGPIPEGLEIDHRNRRKAENRISNLRLTTRSGNLFNTVLRPNRTGVRGVSLHKGGLYRARCGDKQSYHKTLDEAELGYWMLRSRK